MDRSTGWPDVLSFMRDYWLAKRDTRTMPARSDVSPAQLKSQLPHILLADVIDGGADFRYRLVGTQLRQFFYAEPSGKLMSDALAPFGETTVRATLSSYRGVMEQRAPVRLTAAVLRSVRSPSSLTPIWRRCRMTGVAVNMILGTFIFAWDREHQFRAPIDPRLARRNSA